MEKHHSSCITNLKKDRKGVANNGASGLLRACAHRHLPWRNEHRHNKWGGRAKCRRGRRGVAASLAQASSGGRGGYLRAGEAAFPLQAQRQAWRVPATDTSQLVAAAANGALRFTGDRSRLPNREQWHYHTLLRQTRRVVRAHRASHFSLNALFVAVYWHILLLFLDSMYA